MFFNRAAGAPYLVVAAVNYSFSKTLKCLQTLQNGTSGQKATFPNVVQYPGTCDYC